MNVREIWRKELEEENKYRQYQQEIDQANQSIRELTDESEFYVSVYEFFTEGLPHVKIDCDQSALLQQKKENVEACRRQIEELKGRLVGETEQETRLFGALAAADMETIRQLSEEGMTRAMFYYACSEAAKGNLQISRFHDISKKEEPYSAKAEMVILVNEADSMHAELEALRTRVEEELREPVTRRSAEGQRLAQQRQKDSYDELKALRRRAKRQNGKLRDFVNKRLSTATDDWNDGEFLERGTSLENGIASLLDRLEQSNEDLRVRGSGFSLRNPLVAFGGAILIPAIIVAVVIGAEAWVTNNYDGARVYVELDKNPKIVFQYETEADKNNAELPDKILFFETEATTQQQFQYRK